MQRGYDDVDRRSVISRPDVAALLADWPIAEEIKLGSADLRIYRAATSFGFDGNQFVLT
jgi:hypothetical protein